MPVAEGGRERRMEKALACYWEGEHVLGSFILRGFKDGEFRGGPREGS